MGWLVRAIACTSAAGLVACAALAGIDGPEPDDEGAPAIDRGAGSDESVNDSSGGGGATDDDASAPPSPPQPDAGVDAGVDAACDEEPNGEDCDESDECCSRACSETKTCTGSCKSSGHSCDAFSVDQCCVGFFCAPFNAGFTWKCAPCLDQGEDAPKIDTPITPGVILQQACCSRHADKNGKCTKPKDD